MQIKKIFGFSLFVILALFFSANNVIAADFRIANDDNANVHIGQEEQIKNLYTAGNLISINANIQKGLHAAGNVVTVNGNVEGTIYSGAGTLLINGLVGGSVHGGAGSVIISSKITDDLFIAGGNIAISKTASIGNDLFVGGGTIDIQGSVLGNAFIAGGVVTINGEISGNLKIAEADKIKLGPNAKINGNFEYFSKNEIEIDDNAVILGTTSILKKEGLVKTESKKEGLFSLIFLIISLSFLIKVGSLIAIGLVLLYLFRSVTQRVVRESLSSFWKSLGIGLIALIIVPIIAIILLVTLVGVWLGFITGLLYIVSILLAISFASINFGSWLGKLITKSSNYSVSWKVVVGGVIALALVKLIPVIGTLFCLIFTLISFGAIYRTFYKTLRS